MKKFILSIATLVACAISYAQDDYKKLPSLGIHFVLNDFQTASDIRTVGLAKVLEKNTFGNVKQMDPGIAVSYLQGLSRHIDLSAVLSGSFLEYPYPDNRVSTQTKELFMELAAIANLKLLTDRYWVNPFLTGGVGAFKYKGTYGAFIPVGAGIQIKASDNIFFLLNSQYRIPVTDMAAYHFYHSVGIASAIVSRKTKPVEVIVPVAVVLDRDGDGILDADDKCPDTPGLASLQGCPDRDGDGIADGDDKCPDVAGLAKYEGCPIPDTDGDGINDEQDKCPTVKGLARYQGCPIPDTDGDGVNDEEDKCPSRPGPASNMGCPVISKEVIDKINFAAKNVFFATGSYKLLPKSFKSLNEVANLMKADESLMVDIDGHTDAVGSDQSNQVLSDNRAGAVKEYLIKQGVDPSRLKSAGYGETKPVADNTTAAGRAKNRRTEMTVRNY
jgi:outer membrane protein OmpA-like peptidoglycan-associated protein